MELAGMILVVDDQMVNRRILKDLLEKEYELLFARDGREAVEFIEEYEERIAVILLDIVMPRMDGFDVLSFMGMNPQWKRIPVIIMTQNDEYRSEIKALKMGAMDFISKPYRPEILKHKIHNIITFRKTTDIMQLLTKDTLTGIYSKEAFYQKVSEMLERERDKEFNMLSVDIERFKLVNDAYGLKTGDELLVYVAGVIKKACRKIHGICGRIAGDQFAVLCPRNEEKSMVEFAEQVVEGMKIYPLDMRIHAKIGIFEIVDRNMTVSGMYDRAVMATSSLQYGEFYATYDDSIREKLLREQYISNEMQSALEEGQFHVYLQPKYCLKDQKLAGAEALVRWIHPDWGYMMPSEFIPLFEKNGFITEMDIWIWNNVCAFLEKRVKQGLPCVPISVNVSRRDIYNQSLPEILSEMVAKYGIDRKLLHLEITETAYIESPDQLIQAVGRLKKDGFIIEMDDFGSGYSTLNMLSELPIDILKLDMKFIQNAIKAHKENYQNKHNILRFIVGLGKWMDLEMVAEGVETKEQVEFLKDLECDYGQGYYFAKPMPTEEFENLLDKRHIREEKKTEYVNKEEPEWMKETLKDELLPGSLLLEPEGREVMLVADDLTFNRTILRHIFQKRFTIAEAANGKEALDYLREHPGEVSVILLDLVMPVMDGYECLTYLKKEEKLSQIPVIVISESRKNTEATVLQMGASDFIQQPFQNEVVWYRVHHVMEGFRLRKMMDILRKETLRTEDATYVEPKPEDAVYAEKELL